MRILMICTEKLPVPPVLGGAIQTYISGILPYLSKSHDITVLGVNADSLPDEETLDGVHYVRVPGTVFEIYREGVISYLESNQFDLIHIFNRPRLVLPIRKIAPNSKITLSMHNDMFKPDKIEPEEASAVIEEVSNIVTISNYIGEEIKRYFPQAADKIRTIYSGVDIERFLPGHHEKMQNIRNELREKHGLEGKTVILFTGRLSNNKGVDRLVRALPELAKKFNDLALVIVGSKWFSQNDVTDYVAYVRALANKSPVPVITTGFVSPSEIQNWYAASDLFVCTSQWQEPLARVHYEAMAAGLPIVTTARGGNQEIIERNENGLVVGNPEDPSEFVDKISEILSSKSLMKRMGETGRNLAISKYTWDRVANDVLEVWEQSLQSSEVIVEVENPQDDSKIIDIEEIRDRKRKHEEDSKYSTHHKRKHEKDSKYSTHHKRKHEEDSRSSTHRKRKHEEDSRSSTHRKRKHKEDSRYSTHHKRKREKDSKYYTHHKRKRSSRGERKYRDERYTRRYRKENSRKLLSNRKYRTAEKSIVTSIKVQEKIIKSINYRWKPM
ncbi:glycosyltransferase [Margalitia sp. FSL K6-0131]|uniref:glycosyltransferase family 4 protein n=1 Tax=Margalitia sp. FSL K6-0131 TaxID=2954604 RepID=UPI0030FC405F